MKSEIRSSGQDGGVGRNPSLPPTTKRKITTNLKSINNQKCKKINLHGTPTTSELKIQSTRTTTGSATTQQGGLPFPGESLRPCPLTTYQLRLDTEIWPK